MYDPSAADAVERLELIRYLQSLEAVGATDLPDPIVVAMLHLRAIAKMRDYTPVPDAVPDRPAGHTSPSERLKSAWEHVSLTA